MQEKTIVDDMDKYCIICKKNWGKSMRKCCTDNSIIAIENPRYIDIEKKIRYFNLDGVQLNSNDILQLIEQEEPIYYQALEERKSRLKNNDHYSNTKKTETKSTLEHKYFLKISDSVTSYYTFIMIISIALLFVPINIWGINDRYSYCIALCCILSLCLAVIKKKRLNRLKFEPYLKLCNTNISCLPKSGKEWIVEISKIEKVQINAEEIVVYERHGGRAYSIPIYELVEIECFMIVDWFKKLNIINNNIDIIINRVDTQQLNTQFEQRHDDEITKDESININDDAPNLMEQNEKSKKQNVNNNDTIFTTQNKEFMVNSLSDKNGEIPVTFPIQRERSKSLIATLSPFTIFLILLIFIEIVAGFFIKDYDYDYKNKYIIIVMATLLVAFLYYYYQITKSFGAKNPEYWFFGALIGCLTAPIGIAVLIYYHKLKIDNCERGYCPDCGKRIAFDLSICPFCQYSFILKT